MRVRFMSARSFAMRLRSAGLSRGPAYAPAQEPVSTASGIDAIVASAVVQRDARTDLPVVAPAAVCAFCPEAHNALRAARAARAANISSKLLELKPYGVRESAFREDGLGRARRRFLPRNAASDLVRKTRERGF